MVRTVIEVTRELKQHTLELDDLKLLRPPRPVTGIAKVGFSTNVKSQLHNRIDQETKL
jgi:hypothetical protein